MSYIESWQTVTLYPAHLKPSHTSAGTSEAENTLLQRELAIGLQSA